MADFEVKADLLADIQIVTLLLTAVIGILIVLLLCVCCKLGLGNGHNSEPAGNGRRLRLQRHRSYSEQQGHRGLAMGSLEARQIINICSEDDIIEKYTGDRARDLTVLITNLADNEYWNDDEKIHAEEDFVKDLKEMCENCIRKITEIKIKNSPCSKCANMLVEFYIDFCCCRCGVKPFTRPVILIGSIYRNKQTQELDEPAIEKLLIAGFQVGVWHEMHAAMYGESRKTYNILKKIKQNVKNKYM